MTVMTQRVKILLRCVIDGAARWMPRVIRRYDNRKLYDTEQKRYVSLADLARLIREGYQMQVVENATGEDITARTLTNIIVEEERGGQEPLSTSFLHDVIRWGGRVATVTVDQVEQQFDRLLRASLDRLKPVREAREELQKLAERIDRLESAVDELSQSRRATTSNKEVES